MDRGQVRHLDGIDMATLVEGERLVVCVCAGRCGPGFLAHRKRRWCSEACRKRAARRVRSFFVTISPDADGLTWIAQLHPTSLGVHSNGGTRDEAERRLRQALSLAIGAAAARSASFVDSHHGVDLDNADELK